VVIGIELSMKRGNLLVIREKNFRRFECTHANLFRLYDGRWNTNTGVFMRRQNYAENGLALRLSLICKQTSSSNDFWPLKYAISIHGRMLLVKWYDVSATPIQLLFE
jgi:hypothetical protein